MRNGPPFPKFRLSVTAYHSDPLFPRPPPRISSLFGVFALGLAKGRVGTNSALVGLVVGLIVMTTIKFGTPLAWPWFALVGSVVTYCTGALHNKLFNNKRFPDK